MYVDVKGTLSVCWVVLPVVLWFLFIKYLVWIYFGSMFDKEKVIVILHWRFVMMRWLSSIFCIFLLWYFIYLTHGFSMKSCLKRLAFAEIVCYLVCFYKVKVTDRVTLLQEGCIAYIWHLLFHIVSLEWVNKHWFHCWLPVNK